MKSWLSLQFAADYFYWAIVVVVVVNEYYSVISKNKLQEYNCLSDASVGLAL